MNTTVNDDARALAWQQSRFAARVLAAPLRSGSLRYGDGFSVYRRNLHAVAEAALGVTYPTVRWMLGQAKFRALLTELLALYPPAKGDWGEWGAELPALVQHSRVGEEHPFVGPVATLDWLRHRANRAGDNHFDARSLALLDQHPVDRVGIGIARHVGLVRSVYPLVDILKWHADPSASGAALHVSESPRPVLVFRRDFRIHQVYISQADYAFIQGLRAGRSLGTLLDTLTGPEFDFPRWMEQAIARDLINHLYIL